MASAKEAGRRSTVLPQMPMRHRLRRDAVRLAHFGSSQHSARHHQRHSSDAHQVARGHGELELLIDPLQATKHGLANAPDALAPAEMFLDAFANALAQAVTG